MSLLYRFVTNFSDFVNIHVLGFTRMNPMFVLNISRQLNPMFNENNKSLIDDIMTNGVLLATQKKRRTVEKRLVRRFGHEKYPNDCAMIRPKHNVISCDHCGHYHELHTICGNCYKRVKEETNLIVDEIKKRFNCWEPIEEEVEVKYKNDNRADNEMRHKAKAIVEMDRQRPEWFAKNLMSKSTGNKWIESNPIVKEEEPKVI